MPLTPGSRIGSHVVVSLIGEGAMGEVYRARDTTLDRDVAIKRLHDAVRNDPERLARFEREAKTLAALNHPNVAQVYGVEGGTIVMELVPGETLRGPLPLDTALNYAAQIASALDAAHEKGIVHRDLKPGNVMVTPDGVVKVLDFSIAARDRSGIDADPTRSPTMTAATSPGLIVGTVAYMAPEQASGKAVDKRADIWAFGVVLWEMITGRQMFEGETLSHVLAAVLTSDPDLSAAPPRVRPLLARCLEKDPRKRLRDIGDAMSLVEAAGVTGSPHSGPVRSRSMVAAGGGIAAALVGLVAAAIVWSRPGTATTPSPVVRFQIPRYADIYNQVAGAFAVSPDGLRVAYYDTTKIGKHALFVRTLATGEARQVAGSETSGPQSDSLFWSPDGSQLAWGLQLGASVIDITTGAVRRLCDCRFVGGTWNRDDVILIGAARNLRALSGIGRLSLTDHTPRGVTSVEASRGETDRWPVFLPDGKRFLYTRVAADRSTVTWMAALDGGAPKRIVEGSWRLIVSSTTSASGTYLVGIDATGASALPFDLRTATPTGPAVTIVARADSVSGSENGVLAASEAGTRLRTIPTWFDRKGVAVGAVGEGGLIDSVALSADGRRLVVADVAGLQNRNQTDLWVVDLGNGARRRTTFNLGSTPVLSPDGSRIAYSAPRGNRNLPYQRATDGTGDETPFFPYDRDAYTNDWSRDGRWVMYSMPKPGGVDNDLWAVPIAGGSAGKPQLYLEGPGRQQQAQFSPDGRFVAYGSDASGTFDIFVQPFPDASQGKWMISNGGGVEPRWRSDGKELFYVSGQTLMAVPVSLSPTFSHGAPVPLFDAPVQAGYTNDSHRWQLSPDGTRFLLLAPAGQQQAPPLNVIVNWTSLLSPYNARDERR